MYQSKKYELPTIKGPETEVREGPVLYFHIGMPKSGSTWMQKIFSSNSEILRKHQIYYPIPKDETGDFEQVTTFNNNASGFFLPELNFDETWNNLKFADGYSLLLSSEMVYIQILRLLKENVHYLEEHIEYLFKKKFSKIHFLFVVRDPIEFKVSLCSEFMKTGRLRIDEFENWLRENPSTHKYIDKLIDYIRSRRRCQITILNYDTIKNDYYNYIESWLKLPENTLRRFNHKIVNRSLTYAEMYCLSILQKVLKKNLEVLAFQWITKLPEIPADKVYPDHELQKYLQEFNRIDIEKLNKLLPIEHHLTQKIFEPFNPPEKLTFEYAQMDILLKHFVAEITSVEKENESLRETLKNLQNNNLKKVIKKLLRRLKNKLNIRWAQTKNK